MFSGPYAELYIAAIAAVIVFSLLAWYLRVQGKKELLEDARKEALTTPSVSPEFAAATSFISQQPEMRRLQLQAYERLIILCERLGFPSLLGRSPVQQSSAKDLRLWLTQTIQSEFDYNLSQQLYVSPQAWEALKNFKEQQIFIIHQLAETLLPSATGSELASSIQELLYHDENATLQPVVSSLLNKEARWLIQAG